MALRSDTPARTQAAAGKERVVATPHLKNYIDGRWVDGVAGDAFEDLDPATGEVIATATKSTVADVDKAVEAAHRAADMWRLFPAPKRGEILFKAGELMLRRKDESAIARRVGELDPVWHRDPYRIVGDRPAVVRQLQAYIAAGVQGLIVQMPAPFDLKTLEQLAADVRLDLRMD